jgi:hypothetical protein
MDQQQQLARPSSKGSNAGGPAKGEQQQPNNAAQRPNNAVAATLAQFPLVQGQQACRALLLWFGRSTGMATCTKTISQ